MENANKQNNKNINKRKEKTCKNPHAVLDHRSEESNLILEEQLSWEGFEEIQKDVHKITKSKDSKDTMLDVNYMSLAATEEEISKIQQKWLKDEIKIEEDASCTGEVYRKSSEAQSLEEELSNMIHQNMLSLNKLEEIEDIECNCLKKVFALEVEVKRLKIVDTKLQLHEKRR